MVTVQVRPADPTDHEAIGTLTVAAYDAAGRVSDEYREMLLDVAARTDQRTSVLVATDEHDAVLGSITLVGGDSEHFEHPGHGDGGLRMLAVDPAVHGQGIGRALLGAAVGRARLHGWHRLVITTMEWMHRAQQLYPAHGFVRRPDLDVRYGSGLGRAYALDLTDDALDHFPEPGPVPDEPPLFEPEDAGPVGC